MKEAVSTSKISKAGIPQLDDPQLKALPNALKKVYEVLQKSEDVPFPKKYYSAQKTLIRAELHQRREQQPDVPLKDIVASIVQNLPDFIPGNRILELTQFTIQEWQKLMEKQAAGV